MDTMESLCFKTVIEQASNLPNLSAQQQHILERLNIALYRIENESNPSLSSLDLEELSMQV